MDTDIPQNSEWDRSITHQLYGGDWENRMKQEYLLGIGGIMMLEQVRYQETNLSLQRGTRRFDQRSAFGRLYPERRPFIQPSVGGSSCFRPLYGTHPVPAGHDYFDEGLFGRYMGEFPGKLGISWQDFIDMGRENPVLTRNSP